MVELRPSDRAIVVTCSAVIKLVGDDPTFALHRALPQGRSGKDQGKSEGRLRGRFGPSTPIGQRQEGAEIRHFADLGKSVQATQSRHLTLRVPFDPSCPISTFERGCPRSPRNGNAFRPAAPAGYSATENTGTASAKPRSGRVPSGVNASASP